jgi:hypothetical protein
MKKLILPIVPMALVGMLVFGPGSPVAAKGVKRKPVRSERPWFLQTVTGKVIDESGEPLLGVTVLEKGSNKGTVTDAAGRILTGNQCRFNGRFFFRRLYRSGSCGW